MKKLFLIPLMAMLCTVMAFADNVAKIGETEYATMAAAIAAAENGATITLLANTGGDVTLSKDITLNGDKKFTGNITIGASEVTLTLAGVTIDVTGNDAIVHVGKTLNVVVAEGTTNAVYAKSNGCDCFYGTSNGHLNISGNGTLDVYGLEALHVSYMNLSAPNATYGASKTLMYEPHIVSATISAGTFDREFPDSYVTAPLFIEKVSSAYVVSNIGANKAVCDYTAYASLQAAVDAAPAGATIVMYADDNSSVEVGKNLIIDTKGHSINGAVAASGYAKAIMGDKVAFSDNAIAAFLMTDGTASLTIDENADISNAGAIHVNGDKTLTINSDVTVTYKRQGSLANIVVDEGAKLTVLGSGTFRPVMHSETRTIDGFTAEISSVVTDHIGNRIIDVDGELVVGVKDDADNCPHFITSSIARGNAVMVNATGVATFNNANMHVASVSIKNYGTVTIHGGEYVSIATSLNGINGGWYAYHLNNEGRMTVNDGHFVGVQGAFANVSENAIVTINGGSFETVYGHNWATGASNVDNHYALYVACYSVVNVYGGYYKVQTPSLGGNVVVQVGNNDAYNTYGVVNLYGGNFQQKVKVQARKNAESSYPASIPSTSQWYSCFGSEAPLPAGYEYYETGDVTYPWGVRGIAGKEADAIDPTQQAAQEADPDYTIPWQQATTWSEGEVPEENTIVTIPVDATVTVSKDEATKTAEADQIFVSQGATLKVEEGTTLTVGDGGMNIGNGGKVVVEAGATVAIGTSGIITTDEEALVIESTETTQGVLLYDPAVEENTQPKGTVKLYTRSKMNDKATWEYTYQRFALPVYNNASYALTDNFSEAEHGYYDEEEKSYGFESYFFEWNGSAWTTTTRGALQPFAGYQLANNSKNGGVTYTFTGNLIGNGDGEYEFVANGFDFFGNSYTAPINIQKLLEGFQANTPGMEVSVWVYDPSTKNWGLINLDELAEGFAFQTEIPSMEGFLLNLRSGSSATAGVSYASAIWGPLMGGSSPAPARGSSAIDNSVVITVAAQDMADRLTLVEKVSSDASFENGSDASKYMNPSGLNIYAETAAGTLSRVSTNNLEGTSISFNSIAEEQYTLSFSNVNGSDYVLRDNANGTIIELQNGSTYSFYQAANTTATGRFELVSARKIATGIDNTTTTNSTKGIYTVLGQYVGQTTMLSTLPAGVYVVDGVKVVK